MPFKVIDFGTNGNIVHDFLLLINTNLPPILTARSTVQFALLDT